MNRPDAGLLWQRRPLPHPSPAPDEMIPMAQHTNWSTNERILIAIGGRPEDRRLIDAIIQQIHAPQQTWITLIHYMVPLYWEHGVIPDEPEGLEELNAEEAQMETDEEAAAEEAKAHLSALRNTLIKAGIPAEHIQERLDWDAPDTAQALLRELREGAYTVLAVGKHHHDFLTRFLHQSLADYLRKHAPEGVTVWVVPV